MQPSLVTLICIDCAYEAISAYISAQSYHNLEVLEIIGSELENDIAEAISMANGEYICFMEHGQYYDLKRIEHLVDYLAKHTFLDAVLCTRIFINSDQQIIAHDDIAYLEALNNKTLSGKLLLETSIHDNVNLYGNLSTILLKSEYAKQCKFSFDEVPNSLTKIGILYKLLLEAHIGYLYTPYVATYLTTFTEDVQREKDFKKYVMSLSTQLCVKEKDIETNYAPIRRDITFFYTDKGEYYNLKPIADEAQSRGYSIHFTDDIYQKAEIGVYCQHVCYPENSRFSIILLHDMEQAHNRWPNIWENERWNGFDIGILPGEFWRKRWEESGAFYYANPRCGVFELGYPKSDIVCSTELHQRANTLRQKLNLKYEISILYAPSWENDGKEDDFIKALSSMEVNLLIKQASWPNAYIHIIENICEMRRLHEGKFENVYYIEPEESIMTALEICDVVVSDESSVMAEALMFGKPSIAVTDWLIPDTTPSRFSCVPMSYVIKCKKAEIRDTVKQLISDRTIVDALLEEGKGAFANVGSCCKDIMNAIDYYTTEEELRELDADNSFLDKRLVSKYARCTLWN